MGLEPVERDRPLAGIPLIARSFHHWFDVLGNTVRFQQGLEVKSRVTSAVGDFDQQNVPPCGEGQAQFQFVRLGVAAALFLTHFESVHPDLESVVPADRQTE